MKSKTSLKGNSIFAYSPQLNNEPTRNTNQGELSFAKRIMDISSYTEMFYDECGSCLRRSCNLRTSFADTSNKAQVMMQIDTGDAASASVENSAGADTQDKSTDKTQEQGQKQGQGRPGHHAGGGCVSNEENVVGWIAVSACDRHRTIHCHRVSSSSEITCPTALYSRQTGMTVCQFTAQVFSVSTAFEGGINDRGSENDNDEDVFAVELDEGDAGDPDALLPALAYGNPRKKISFILDLPEPTSAQEYEMEHSGVVKQKRQDYDQSVNFTKKIQTTLAETVRFFVSDWASAIQGAEASGAQRNASEAKQREHRRMLTNANAARKKAERRDFDLCQMLNIPRLPASSQQTPLAQHALSPRQPLALPSSNTSNAAAATTSALELALPTGPPRIYTPRDVQIRPEPVNLFAILARNLRDTADMLNVVPRCNLQRLNWLARIVEEIIISMNWLAQVHKGSSTVINRSNERRCTTTAVGVLYLMSKDGFNCIVPASWDSPEASMNMQTLVVIPCDPSLAYALPPADRMTKIMECWLKKRSQGKSKVGKGGRKARHRGATQGPTSATTYAQASRTVSEALREIGLIASTNKCNLGQESINKLHIMKRVEAWFDPESEIATALAVRGRSAK